MKLPGGTITRRQLKNSFSGNQDGAGMAYAHEGKLHVDKGYFGFRKFYKKFREAEQAYPDSAFMLHFRIATSGSVSKECCHPFNVSDDLAFIHNGVFTDLGTKEFSDTQVFNTQVLQRLPEDFLNKPEILASLDNYMKKSLSKMILLNSKQDYVIFNEGDGYWVDDVWFSNSGYKYVTSYKTMGFGYYNNYCGSYNDGYLEHLNDTYRKCGTCCVYQPLSKLTWKTADIPGGDDWICDRCANIDYYSTTGQVLCRCAACKEKYPERDGITLSTGTFYCNGCWFAIRTTYTISCPHCGSNMMLDEDDNCTFCGGKVEEEDYACQLANASADIPF